LIYFRFSEYLADIENVFREYQLVDGEIRGIKEDSQNNGEFDHFMDISAWILQAGRRDINNDGIIDVFEYYENGKISGIAVDWNNNGKPEYLEDWSILNIKTWDFDEDSFIDAEYLSSFNDKDYSLHPIEITPVNQYDTFYWDFSFKNFWFNNN
jgi:antitoxin component YwqK of YwqJK toxin-antitoxin module